jgi:hypothetical protein
MPGKAKLIYLLVLFFSLGLILGCETTKGAAKGLAYGVGYTVEETSQGVKKDSIALYKFMCAADNWIKENLW